MKFTITSLNLQGFDNWDARAPHILTYLQSVSPDVICFQESVYLPSVSAYNPAQVLNKELGYPHEFSDITRLQVGLEHPVYREGLTTLSRQPAAKSETLILKQAEDDEHNRIVQLLDIQIKDGPLIKIAHIHFSITDIVDYATAHLKEVLTILESRNEKRVIIGDFNLTHLEESSELWGSDYISTCDTPYITYPTKNKRVDYALVPNEFSIDSIDISKDGLSDHRALTVTIIIPDPV